MTFSGSQFLQTVKYLNGKPITDETNEELTVKECIRRSLAATLPEEAQNPDGDKKFKDYMLAARVFAISTVDETIELAAEEIARIKKKLALLGTEIMGFIYLILEGKNNDFKVVAPAT